MNDTYKGDRPVELIESLASILEDHSLTSLEYRSGDTRVMLKKEPSATQMPVSVHTVAAAELIPGNGKPGAPEVAAGMQNRATQSAGPEVTGDQDPSTAHSKAEPAAHPEDPDIITSPLVGIAYLAKEPGAPPFVALGDQVKEGDVLCLIEAMKMFNEVKAPHAGLLNKVHFSDGELVEFGAALFTLGR